MLKLRVFFKSKLSGGCEPNTVLKSPETFSPQIHARKLPEATTVPFLEEKTEDQTAALLRGMGRLSISNSQNPPRLLSAPGNLMKQRILNNAPTN